MMERKWSSSTGPVLLTAVLLVTLLAALVPQAAVAGQPDKQLLDPDEE